MSTYIKDILNHVNDKKSDKGTSKGIIFITVGPSGSGKSHLTSCLKKEIENMSIHSLDDYRIKCNNGKYPENTAVHDRVNQIAIPLYRESVLKEQSKYILLDNTHLRWDPDWQLPIQKAKRDGYDIFPIVPPATEYLLHSCRSTHIGTGATAEDIFRKMCARWPGFRMGHLLHRRISGNILDDVFPSKADSFSVNKMFHINWGKDGYLYVLDNYLGYVDKDMITHAIKAGNYVKKVAPEGSNLFLRKDSLLHITLIPPGKMNTDVLRNVARTLSQKNPPKIEYVGIQDITDSRGNRLLFLSISQRSNAACKAMVDSITRKPSQKSPINMPSIFNPDGIHVTLGFSKCDMWGIKKICTPKWNTIEWDTLPEVFEWTIKEPLTERNIVRETNMEDALVKAMRERFPAMEAFKIPDCLKNALAMLLSHPEVKHKWKDASSINTQCIMGKNLHHRFHILNLVASPPRFRSDDETYKKYAKLRDLLPRGLTVIFDCKSWDPTTVEYVNAVYPTPKFFGDNDLEEEVEVISDGELQQSYAGKEAYIVTEKANGEMFTFTVIHKETDVEEGTLWVIAMGSKNNKFLFKFHTDFVEDCIDEGIQAQLRAEGKVNELTQTNMTDSEWTNTNLWVEMCSVFGAKLASIPSDKLVEMMNYLYDNNLTLCGEFESYLHPHLVAFDEGHQKVIFFAVTGHDEGYKCRVPDALENMKILDSLHDNYGLDVVTHYESHDTIMKIKDDIRMKKKVEGVVVLMVKDGKVVDRVKLKTIWYVVHRGFREKLRKMINSAVKENRALKATYVSKILSATLKDKLAIFSLETSWKDAGEYVTYVRKAADYVDERSTSDLASLKKQFLYDYPGFIRACYEHEIEVGK